MKISLREYSKAMSEALAIELKQPLRERLQYVGAKMDEQARKELAEAFRKPLPKRLESFFIDDDES